MIRTLMVFALAAAVLAGCGSQNDSATDSAVVDQPLPDWVLVVPVEKDGRSLFVGGCSMALSADEGVEAARTDAHLQIASEAGSRFTDVFALSPRASGITTTSIDRLDFRETGMASYAEAMENAAELDRVHLRSCTTGASLDVWELPSEIDIEGTVCSVFVRVSFEADAWERHLAETLTEMRHDFAQAGRDNLADLASWIEGRLPELMYGEGGQEQQPDAGDR